MNISTREQKSLYLAFALTTSIQFNSLKDEYQKTSCKYCFNLCKGQQILYKTKTFGIQQIVKQSEMYLYLILTHFDNLTEENYSIKMTQQSQTQVKVIFQEKINLHHYVEDHRIHNKDFWTEISPQEFTQKFTLRVKKRIFMKKNKFQLDDIINSEDAGQQHDTVGGLDHSPTILKTSKFAIDKRKSKSFQSSLGNFTPIPPRRLDTISEQDSNIPMTQRRDKEDFMYGSDSNGRYKVRQRFSQGIKANSEGFQSALKRQSTWIQKNGNTDVFDELVSAFQHSSTAPNIDEHIDNFKKQQSSKFMKESNKIMSKNSLESQFTKINSKSSKLTKASQHQQEDENQLSFLDKSSLLMDLQKSQLNITPDQQVCFKLKWILLLIVVVALAAFSSMSTDAFALTQGHKHKQKKNKKANQSHKQGHGKNQKLKNQQKTKSNKNKHKKQIHA